MLNIVYVNKVFGSTMHQFRPKHTEGSRNDCGIFVELLNSWFIWKWEVEDSTKSKRPNPETTHDIVKLHKLSTK